jgi:hypothetical protein
VGVKPTNKSRVVMPSSPGYKRNYRQEARYDSKPNVKKKRANRNYARRKAVKAGLARRGDGKDVHHVGGNAMNRNGRTRVISASANRSYARTKNARKRNPRA